MVRYIQAPNNKKLEVEIEKISPGFEMEGCIIAGIEIKTNDDQRRTG